MSKNVMAVDLTVKYSINDKRFVDSFLLNDEDVQDIINLVVILIDQFNTKDIEINTSDAYLIDSAKVATKQVVMESLITNIERIKDLENDSNKELSLIKKID